MKPDSAYTRERIALIPQAEAIADTTFHLFVDERVIKELAQTCQVQVATVAWNRVFHAAMERLWREHTQGGQT